MGCPGEMVHPRVLRNFNVAGVPRVGMGWRNVANPVVALGVEMNYQRVGAGTLPKPLVALGEGVRNSGESEGIAFRRPRMLFVLAGVTSDLGKTLVLKQAAAASVGVDRVEDLSAGRVLVPTLVNVFADYPAAQRGSGAVDFLDLACQWVRVPGVVMGLVAQHRQQVADTQEAQVHDPRAFGIVDELVDPTRLEAALDIEVVD